MLYANSEGPDGPADLCTLNWTCSVHQTILQNTVLQPARMTRVCVVRKVHIRTIFIRWASYDIFSHGAAHAIKVKLNSIMVFV